MNGYNKMEWYWILTIAIVIFPITAHFVEEFIVQGNKGASTIVGISASILFVLIMIYDKL